MLLLLPLLLAAAGAAPLYRPVPGGLRVWHECMHEVAAGAAIDDRGADGVWVTEGTTTRMLPHCSVEPRQPAPRRTEEAVDLQGWQTWATYQNPSNAVHPDVASCVCLSVTCNTLMLPAVHMGSGSCFLS